MEWNDRKSLKHITIFTYYIFECRISYTQLLHQRMCVCIVYLHLYRRKLINKWLLFVCDANTIRQEQLWVAKKFTNNIDVFIHHTHRESIYLLYYFFYFYIFFCLEESPTIKLAYIRKPLSLIPEYFIIYEGWMDERRNFHDDDMLFENNFENWIFPRTQNTINIIELGKWRERK